MRIDQLPARKQREIAVGRKFIEAYNRRACACFRLDESYWNVEPDPAPDLRFVSPETTIFGEVVAFDEAGQEGFVRAAATGRLLTAVEEALGAVRAHGFVVMIEIADPRKVPHGQRLWADAHALARYCVEKADLLKQQRFQLHRHYEQAWSFALANVHDLDIFLSTTSRASCAVSGGVRMIDSAGALAEVIQGKGLKRYGPRTHLLVDGQGHFVTGLELLEVLEGRLVSIDGYEGVWFVGLREGAVLPLHEKHASGTGSIAD